MQFYENIFMNYSLQHNFLLLFYNLLLYYVTITYILKVSLIKRARKEKHMKGFKDFLTWCKNQKKKATDADTLIAYAKLKKLI